MLVTPATTTAQPLSHHLAECCRNLLVSWTAAGSAPTWADLTHAWCLARCQPGNHAVLLAHEAGCNREYAALWLKGRHAPPLHRARTIARLLALDEDLVLRSVRAFHDAEPVVMVGAEQAAEA